MSKLERAIKALGVETLKEMESMDEVSLKKRIVEANESMRQADDELEVNEKYQQVKADMKAVTAGKRDVDRRQKAVICVALNLINPPGDPNA